MAIMPIAYRAIIGKAINHIVTPLPSGVIIAPNTEIIISAYLKFFSQNFESVTPLMDNTYIMTGS
jgi:hypothetical protein